MTAWKLYGPDGRVMVTAPNKGRQLLPAESEALEKAWATDVAKRVRSRATSMAVADRERGRQKPTPVTFDTLRLCFRRNEWLRAIVQTRKNQLAGKQWSVKVKDEDASGVAQKAAKEVTRLLQRPMMHGSQPQTTTWRQWLGMYVEDLLVLDRAAIEKERTVDDRMIVALYPVDGSTIRPVLDERGAFERDAYVQVVQGQIEARYGMEELVVGIENPQTDVHLSGYGMSPVESLLVSVTADLHAAKFNASYFERGIVPEGIINLGEDVDPEQVDAFRIYWLNEISGRPWATPIIGGSKAPEWMPLRESNRDMQFMEFQQWLLQKMCAVFQISPKELGQIDDVNRSTAEDASQSDDEKGLQPLMAHVKDMIDLEIIGEHGQGLGDYLEFEWEQAGETADQINQKYQPMHQSGVATGAEWRDAHGMDPDGDPDATHGKEGLHMHLSGGEQKPLPNHADADQAGLAAQNGREDQMRDEEFGRDDENADKEHQRAMEREGGGPPTGVPWKPANPDDPNVKQAMADHDDEHGIGPRNVGKTADRHPALTGAEDDLTRIFDQASQRLIDGLTELLAST